MEIEIAITRIVITFALSLLFGYERQRSHKPAGLGTFAFVAMGSCALSIAALSLSVENPMPLLGAIVTGIGFLGAGTLIKSGDRVFGVTTATSIWLFAIFGLIMGIGYYSEAVVIYILVWVIVAIDMQMERGGAGYYHKKITVTMKSLDVEKDLLGCIKLITKKCKLIGREIDKKKRRSIFTFIVEAKESDMESMITALKKKVGFESLKME